MTIEFIVSRGVSSIENALKISFDGEMLKAEIYSDFSERPLTLASSAKDGDKALIVIREAVIELYVAGELCDEEWQYGELFILKSATKEFGKINIKIDRDSLPERNIPRLRNVSMPELRRRGVNVGDCMPFEGRDGRLHLFWLYDRHHHCSKWGKGAHQWAHSSTLDLKKWDEHPMAIVIDRKWEGSICTGSTIFCGDKYYAWYAVRMTDGSPAKISYAISTDNENYVKSEKYFTLPPCYDLESARDPRAFVLNGRYHLLITTSDIQSGKGCLAHLVSDNADMSFFTDLGAIIMQDGEYQPECPDFFEANGYYYLLWSSDGTARYAYSKKPFEDEWIIPDDNAIMCGKVPKSAVLPMTGERIFVGFENEDDGYAGSFIVKKANFLPDGRIEITDK